jgi:hypothetical protein
MKKNLLSVLFLLLTISGISQRKSKDLRLGFLLEPTLAWFNPQENGLKSDGTKFGVNYGLMLDYEFADNYIFSTGLQVSHLGGKLSYTGNSWQGNKVGYIAADNSSVNNTANYNIALQYLQIPFALKLKGDNKGLNFWGSFGGFLAMPLKARADVETNFAVNGVANFKAENDKIISRMQPINIGMQLAVGIELPISDKNTLVAGLAFNNGFIDVTKNSQWGNDGRVNMNNLSLKLGVFF